MKILLTEKDAELIRLCLWSHLDNRYSSDDTESELRNLEYKLHNLDEKLCEMLNNNLLARDDENNI